MEVSVPGLWKAILQQEFEQPYFAELQAFVEDEYAHQRCYPSKREVFAAFEHCSFDKIKVVIIGQDPYHGEGQANGLCFSVKEGIALPPSLVNIFKELERDLGVPMRVSGNLERWAEQGVLLLNATLTVRSGEAGSHQKRGWERFTDAVIERISVELEGVVFLLWGSFAKKKGLKIDRTKHLVLEAGHPSPLSANRGLWFGHHPFSLTNAYLKGLGKAEIKW
jgi:uracil-DNA glycosylase